MEESKNSAIILNFARHSSNTVKMRQNSPSNTHRLDLSAKKIWKYVYICQSYDKNSSSILFFETERIL